MVMPSAGSPRMLSLRCKNCSEALTGLNVDTVFTCTKCRIAAEPARGCGRGGRFEGGGAACSRPLILAWGRGGGVVGWPRSTESEIPSGGARNEMSRPKGGETEFLVEPIGIDPTTS